MTDSELLLEASGLGRRKPNSDGWLLRDISVQIHAGRRLAIVGPTGSGKTLLLRALARLDPIDSGKILWRGDSISGDAIPRFRREAIYLHQRPALVEGTVEENLRLPFMLWGHQTREYSQEEILSLLERVNRNETLISRSTRDLSGGEAQIVALLRAIQLEPTMLLLDEPTATLDEESTRMIEQLVAGWLDRSHTDRALMWVSHNKEQIARVADHVMAMSDGRLFDHHDGSAGQPQ